MAASLAIMLIARALLAKIRPPRLNPREVQEQVDVTRAAVLTAAYAVGGQEQEQEHDRGDETYLCDKLEKEIAALKPPARKLRVQTAINDQVRDFRRPVLGRSCACVCILPATLHTLADLFDSMLLLLISCIEPSSGSTRC